MNYTKTDKLANKIWLEISGLNAELQEFYRGMVKRVYDRGVTVESLEFILANAKQDMRNKHNRLEADSRSVLAGMLSD